MARRRSHIPVVKYTSLSIIDLMLGMIFPPLCVVCRRIGPLICDMCVVDRVWDHVSHCPSCNSPNSPLRPCTCGVCPPLAVLSDMEHIRPILHHAKYKNTQTLLTRLLLTVTGRGLETLALYTQLKNPILIPIPLHRDKYATRGYNQVEEIALTISHITGIPMDTTHLVKTRNTPPQAKIQDRKSRKSNTQDIFEWRGGDVSEHSLIIIDDVVTTGSTLSQAVRAIRKRSPSPIYTLALAQDTFAL